jgi:non-canonical purine NTP pyrophosphatase (RdgB/HAM1 family)
MHIFFATSNKGKVPSVARVLAEFGIEVRQFDVDIPELQAETASEIAFAKAKWAFEQLSQPVIVVDSAFHILNLGGFPGPNVKWATKQIGLEGYLRLLSPWQKAEDRSCSFQDALAYMDGQLSEPKIFLRNIYGHLGHQITGEKKKDEKSPLWRLFIPRGHKKTLAEMSDEELLAHRKEPFNEQFYRDFATWLTTHQK